MARYTANPSDPQSVYIQRSNSQDMQTAAVAALLALGARLVSAITLSGSGSGTRFSLRIEHTAAADGEGLSPAEVAASLRLYQATSEPALTLAYAAALAAAQAAAPGVPLRDVITAGSGSAGVFFGAVVLATQVGGGGAPLTAGLGRYYFVDDLLGNDGTAQPNSLNYRYKTIAAAVADAVTDGEEGATVFLAPGTYAEEVDLTGVPSAFTLKGTDPSSTVIDTGVLGRPAVVIYADATGIDRMTIRDLTVNTRAGDWGIYVDGPNAVLSELCLIDNVRSISLEAGSQGLYLENVTKATIRNSVLQGGGESTFGIRIANCGDVDIEVVRVEVDGSEIDLRYGVSPTGTPPARGIYRLREVWIAENLRMAGYPKVYADSSVTLNPSGSSSKVYTPVTGTTLSGAPNNLGADIEFHGAAGRFSIYLATYDATQLQRVDLSAARFTAGTTCQIGVAAGVAAWANSQNLQGIQAPFMSQIDVGAGMLVEGAGANVNPNVWTPGAGAKINANAIGGDTVGNGTSSKTVTLPFTQNDTAYLVYVEWSTTGQAYSITNKAAGQFDVEVPAAVTGDQAFLYALRRIANL